MALLLLVLLKRLLSAMHLVVLISVVSGALSVTIRRADGDGFRVLVLTLVQVDGAGIQEAVVVARVVIL